MLVRIDVVNLQAGEYFVLGFPFVFDLGKIDTAEEISLREFGVTCGQAAIFKDQRGHFFRRRQGFSEDEGQVDTEAEAGQFRRFIEGVPEAVSVGKQGGTFDQARLVAGDDAVIDGFGESEVIGVDYDLPGYFNSFLRRRWYCHISFNISRMTELEAMVETPATRG